jgi:hypothetical protein
MNPDLDALRQQQQSLLQRMQAIDRLRRGGLSRQFFPPTRRGAPRRGPYYLLQGFCRGRKFSQRVPADQAPQVQQDVEHYRCFQALADQYVTVTDQLTRALDAAPDAKKNSSPRRSPTPSSAKPTPS